MIIHIIMEKEENNMKVNYSIEIEPQETEVICKCLTDVFGIYADAKTKGSIPAALTQELINKICNLLCTLGY